MMPIIPHTTTLNLLIVDDETSVLNAFDFVLTSKGFSVETSSNGNAALKRIMCSIEDNSPIQCVIADYKMPGMNGIDLFRSVKKIAPHIICILITAYSSATIRRQALALGVSAFLEKPFPVETLLKTLSDSMHHELDLLPNALEYCPPLLRPKP